MKKDLKKLFSRQINQSVAEDYRRLVVFVDAAISQAFKLSGDERAEFLIKNMLNLRDFMSSEITVEATKLNIKDEVIKLFDSFVSDCDLDLDALEKIKIKKKEEELKAQELQPENTLVTDPQMSSVIEEE